LDVIGKFLRYAKTLEICLEIHLIQDQARHHHYLDYNQQLDLERQVWKQSTSSLIYHALI